MRGENPGRGCDTRPARWIAPRNLLQLSASASNAPTDNPPLAIEVRPRQEDFFLVPFCLLLVRPESPKAPEKGALLLRLLCFQPCWAEEEGAVEACCCDRGTTGEAPPRSAEEADGDPALDDPAEDLRGIFGRIQRLLNKSVVQSCTHLVQGRVMQGRWKNNRRQGKVSTT